VPLSLPNLDDLSWEDLLKEGRRLIPAWAPEWTDHNPTDPGITLLELFAYFSEKLLYQLNRIGDKNILQYLLLLNGPDWASHTVADAPVRQWLEVDSPSGWELHSAVAEEKRKTLNVVREIRRAVSCADFEMLAAAIDGVARAKCIARRNLEIDGEDRYTVEFPGHISVLVIPNKAEHPSRELLTSVKRALEPARLLTTRVHVVGPRYLRLGCHFAVVPKRGTPAQSLKDAVIRRLQSFFDPLTAGADGKGWPVGGNVYVSEIYRVLADVPGLEAVTPARDLAGAPLDELVVEPTEASRVRRNSRGEVDAVVLRADELVEARIDPDRISIMHPQ
jgi:Baseplate J-like protein